MTSPFLGTAVGRRRVTAGLLTACSLPLVAACDVGDDDPPGLPSVREDPDEQLLGAALDAERALLELVRRTRSRHRVLRPPLRSPLDVHRAHVGLLAEAVEQEDGDAGAANVPRDPAVALTALVRRERAVADAHVRLLMRARSGTLARLLAVMAAASQQQAAVLSQVTPGPRGGRG